MEAIWSKVVQQFTYVGNGVGSMITEESFEVSRGLTNILGWFFIFLGFCGITFLFLERSPRLFLPALLMFVFGYQMLLSSRNVKKIIVDECSIRFLPIGEEFRFSEAKKLYVPSWADRFDTPPNVLGALTIETSTTKARYVPGAILHWKNRCRLSFYGCDGNRMLATLRQYVEE